VEDVRGRALNTQREVRKGIQKKTTPRPGTGAGGREVQGKVERKNKDKKNTVLLSQHGKHCFTKHTFPAGPAFTDGAYRGDNARRDTPRTTKA
jgi:hypothetical protein